MGLTRSEVADWLLQEKFMLTALEFHTELVENGTELVMLSDYFSNPANFNFELESADLLVASPGSLASEVAFEFESTSNVKTYGTSKQKDQRIAVLEFELRQVKEQLRSLRNQVTTSLKTDSTSSLVSDNWKPTQPTQFSNNYTLNSNSNTLANQPSIVKGANQNTPQSMGVALGNEESTPLERRAINFIINHYLQQCNYKLTAITFADEIDDQDFEDWEDVGLNMPQPQSLLQYFRTNQSVPQVNSMTTLEDGMGSTSSPNKAESGLANAKPLTRTTSQPIVPVEQACDFRTSKSMSFSAAGRTKMEMENDLPVTRQRLKNLRKQHEDLKKENENLKGKIQALEIECGRETANRAFSTEQDHDGEEEDLSHKSLRFRKFSSNASLQRPNAFRSVAERVLAYGPMKNRLSQEVLHIKQYKDDAVDVLARCLPYIVPHVLLNKREELLPVIIVTILRHRDPKTRDELTHTLFNLIKRPDDIQRRVIINGSIALAQGIGPDRCEAELMPQCWEQLAHKFPERRTLVAEACGALAKYLKIGLRSSLTLSILQQLMGDNSELVRQAACKNMGLLITYIDDPIKYTMVEKHLLEALIDPSDRVVLAAQAYMLPSLAQWACEIAKFETGLVAKIMKSVGFTLDKVTPFSMMEDATSCDLDQSYMMSTEDLADESVEDSYWMESLANNTIEEDEADEMDALPAMATKPTAAVGSHGRYHSLDLQRKPTETGLPIGINHSPISSRATQGSISPMVEFGSEFSHSKRTKHTGLKYTDNPLYSLNTLLGDESKLWNLRYSFDNFLKIYIEDKETAEKYKDTWSVFTWVHDTWLPEMLELIGRIPPACTEAVRVASRLVYSTCKIFGVSFTKTFIQPFFLKKLGKDVPLLSETKADGLIEDIQVCDDDDVYVLPRLLPMYIDGVLRSYGADGWEEAMNCIQETLVKMALDESGWPHSSLPVITQICSDFCQEETGSIDQLMDLVRELVCHQSPCVRAALAHIFTAVVPHASVTQLKDRLIPACIALSNDQELDVRMSIVPCFGTVLERTRESAVVDKIKMQLQTLLDSEENADRTIMVVVTTLGEVVARVDTQLRDEFILPRLYEVVTNLIDRPPSDDSKRLAGSLVQAYQNSMQCFKSSSVIQEMMIPALSSLLKCTNHINTSEKEKVEVMLRQTNPKGDDHKDTA
eukprot:Ihof_evm27s12 gene=Ihof_evmTU27s12